MAGHITERKQTEEQVRFQARLLDAVGQAVIATDLEGKAIYWNRAAEDLFGWSKEEVINQTLSNFVISEDLRERAAEIRSEIREGKIWSGEFVVRRKDGTTFPAMVINTPVYDEQGELAATIGVFADVAERKRAEEALRESEERYRAVMEQSAEAIWLFDPDTKQVLESNTPFQELLGYTPEEMRGMTNYDFVAHDREDIDATVGDKMQDGEDLPAERKYRRKDGTLLDVEVNGTMISYRGKEVVCSVARNLTERKRTEEALKESEERFRTAFEDAPLGVALVDLEGHRLRVNRALCEMLGYRQEELLGKDYLENVHPDDREISTEYLRKMLTEGAGSYTLERRYVRADGSAIWNLTSVSLIRDSEGNPSHLVCFHQDTTERKRLEEQLRYQAFYDSLTELPNRALFLDRLEHALNRMRREGAPVVALFVDLDDFKVINDSMGHDAGNALLVEVANRLRDSVRPGDTIGRIFGDEFALLLGAPAGVEEGRRVAERIAECLRKPFLLRGREAHVSCSIGIAFGEGGKDRPEEVLRHADLAMYAAKSRGKNQYHLYDPTMEERAAKRMDLESDLRQAVEREELKVYYQPKVLLEPDSNRIASVEALVRWEHPERGLLLPGEFIPLAEETGLIAPLGRWVLEKACQQARRWKEQYLDDPPLVVCVNLSAKQFRLSNLQEEVAQVLRATGLQARCVHLEVTEGIAMEDVESTVAMLRELKDLGVLLTVDDFGMGYSSLSYLDRLPVDILKVATPFVAQLTGNPESVPLISAIINLAHALNLTTIAEGVENAQQLAELKEMGCDMAQGYYFAKPLPPESVGELLARGVLP